MPLELLLLELLFNNKSSFPAFSKIKIVPMPSVIKIWMLMTGLFLMVSALPAQEDSQFIVVQTSGRVEYLAGENAQPSRVLPGQVLPLRGLLQFDEQARAKLLFEGQTRELKQAGLYELEKIFRKDTKMKGLGFMHRFWNFVTEGVSSAGTSEQLEKYHQRYMDKAGGIKGFAQADFGITVSAVTRAVLAEPTVSFEWEPASAIADEVAPLYKFVIYRELDGELVFQAVTAKNALAIDLTQFHIIPGDDYFWQVIREGVADEQDQFAARSARVEFTFQPDALGTGLERLKADEDYRRADATEQGLMEAATLEWEGLIYSADSIYRELLANQSDNALVRKLYAAFLARNASLEESQDALTGLAAGTPSSVGQH